MLPGGSVPRSVVGVDSMVSTTVTEPSHLEHEPDAHTSLNTMFRKTILN